MTRMRLSMDQKWVFCTSSGNDELIPGFFPAGFPAHRCVEAKLAMWNNTGMCFVSGEGVVIDLSVNIAGFQSTRTIRPEIQRS
jgi:hypothetical protein